VDLRRANVKCEKGICIEYLQETSLKQTEPSRATGSENVQSKVSEWWLLNESHGRLIQYCNPLA
jgi:hypothetical protein